MNIQFPIPALDISYADLTQTDNKLVNWFANLNIGRMEQILYPFYSGRGPKGFRKISFVLLDLLRAKQNIISYRRIFQEVKDQTLYQHLTLLSMKDSDGRYIRVHQIPNHQTLSAFHDKVGIRAYRELLSLTVDEANELGLLDSQKPYWRKGLQTASDSTFVLSKVRPQTYTHHKRFFKGTIAFGRKHHLYRVALGYKAHWLVSLPRRIILQVTTSPANMHDVGFTLPLIEQFLKRHALQIAYHLGDKGFADDEIRQTLWKRHRIVALFPLKENAVYPNSFSPEGWPRCPFGYWLHRKGTDYKLQRTQYYCGRVCLPKPSKASRRCRHLRSDKVQGYTFYTHFREGLGKFGPVHPLDKRFRRLYNHRVLTEQVHSLAKILRYRMEQNLTTLDAAEFEIQALIHAICLNYDEIVKERNRRIKS